MGTISELKATAPGSRKTKGETNAKKNYPGSSHFDITHHELIATLTYNIQNLFTSVTNFIKSTLCFSLRKPASLVVLGTVYE